MEVTLADLWERQNERCAICSAECIPVVDHDHHTDLVRGLLCPSCNTLEGMPVWGCVMPFHLYRLDPPARQIGLVLLYGDRTSDPFYDVLTEWRRDEWMSYCIRLAAGLEPPVLYSSYEHERRVSDGNYFRAILLRELI